MKSLSEENPDCPHCGSTEFYILKGGYRKCKKCRQRNTGTNGTYLSNLKIPVEKLKRLVELICDNPAISIRELCEKGNVASNTGNIKKRLIVSAIVELNSRDPEQVIKKLFTHVQYEGKPMELLGTGTMKSLTDDQVRKIKELRAQKVSGTKIAEMFQMDVSNVYKIAKGQIYKSVK